MLGTTRTEWERRLLMIGIRNDVVGSKPHRTDHHLYRGFAITPCQFCYLLETSKGASRLLSGERPISFSHLQSFDPEALKS
jgi:hypothetical protein